MNEDKYSRTTDWHDRSSTSEAMVAKEREGRQPWRRPKLKNPRSTKTEEKKPRHSGGRVTKTADATENEVT